MLQAQQPAAATAPTADVDAAPVQATAPVAAAAAKPISGFSLIFRVLLNSVANLFKRK